MSTYKYLNDTGLTYLWGKIKAFFKTYYGTCSTGASTQMKEVTCPGFVLVEGARIDVKFTNAQSFNASDSNPLGLNVNNTGNKQVMSRGTTILPRYAWQAGEVVRFVYDGTRWVAQNNGIATTTYYGRTKLSSSVSSTSTSVSATPSAVKQAYDLATQADTQATTNAGNIATNTSNITANTNKISELDQYITGTRGDGTGAVNFCLLHVSLNRTLVSGLKVHVYCPSDAFVETKGEWLMPLSFSIDNETTYIQVLGANGETITGQDAVGRYLELYYNGTNWIALNYGTSENYSIGGNLAVTGTVTSTGGFSGNVTGNVTGNLTGNVSGNLTGNSVTLGSKTLTLLDIDNLKNIGTSTSVSGTYTTGAWTAGTASNCTWVAPRDGKYIIFVFFQANSDTTGQIYKQLQLHGTATRPLGNYILYQGGETSTSGSAFNKSIISISSAIPISATQGQTIYPYIHTPQANLVWNIKISGMYVGNN